VISDSNIARHSTGPVSWAAQRLVRAGLLIVTAVYLWNTLPMLTTLPRINVDEPWLIERAYQWIVSGRPRQPMFLLDEGYLLQPGYGLLLAPWLKLFGVGLLQARLLAVLFGLATLWFVYTCGKQLFGAPVGIVAAMFLATDSNFLGVSRFARTDGPAVFFAALSLAWFLEGRAGRAWFLFGSGAAAGVAMLCHLNCYWVVVVLGAWHLQTYGRRFLRPALVSAAGFAVGFGPYLILILTRFKDFNAQLNIFASERVPSLSVSVIAHQIARETDRYRDWYFGLITDFTPNPLLTVFKACSVLGVAWLIGSAFHGVVVGRRRRSEELLAVAVVLTAFIFAAFIPNKALVYLPHLVLGFSLASGYFVVCAIDFVCARARMPRDYAAAAVVGFLLLEAAGAGLLYAWWYRQMLYALTPYGVTEHSLKLLVPPGSKYVVASPTFWLAFHDDPQTKFVAYTAAAPYKTVEPMGFFTRHRLYDLPQDRPFYLLVDDVEWKSILDDPTYDAEWRATWIGYIEGSCALYGASTATAHGTIALYRCSNDGTRPPIEPLYVRRDHRYQLSDTVWTGSAADIARWTRYTPQTNVTREDGAVRVAGSRAGVYSDIPVTAGVPYLLDVDVTGARAGDFLSTHSVSPAGKLRQSTWLPLKTPTWFPHGTIVVPSQNTLRVYLYSDSATDFRVRSVKLSRLREDTPAAARR
jgi:4-amino-4-deoxy-L-arabinose transferase-like glycosyltransferase